MKKNFNIRVYGIVIQNDEILLSNEQYGKHRFVKFVGGGLKQGESTIDCLKREFKEELDQDIEIIEHFYTTDFFQASMFDPNQQVISIYYKVNIKTSLNGDFTHVFWKSLQELTEDSVSLPIDKYVVKLLTG